MGDEEHAPCRRGWLSLPLPIPAYSLMNRIGVGNSLIKGGNLGKCRFIPLARGDLRSQLQSAEFIQDCVWLGSARRHDCLRAAITPSKREYKKSKSANQ